MALFETFTTGIGIDISEHHLRIAQMSWSGNVLDTFETTFEDGLIVDEKVEKPEELKKIVTKAVEKSPFTKKKLRATLLIPDSRVFSASFLLPKDLRGEKMKTEAFVQAQRQVPIPFTRAYTSVSQGEKEEEGIRTTVYAVEKEIADKYLNIFSETPFKIRALEANTKSIHRLVKTLKPLPQKAPVKTSSKKEKEKEAKTPKKQEKEGNIAVVDVGHSWATISVFTPLGSSLFSRSIAYQHVEEKASGKASLPKKIVDTLIETVKEAVIYFEKQDVSISAVYLSGVEARFEDVSSRLEEMSEKGITRLVGDAFEVNGLNKKTIHVFGAATGAAIRSAHPRRYAYQHNLLNEIL